MSDSEHVKLLLNTAIKHTRELSTAFGVIGDFACLIEENLPRCFHPGCRHPATVKHPAIGTPMCDECAARTIVNAAASLNLPDDMGALRDAIKSVSDEQSWIDLPNATRIRRLVDYVSMLTKDDESHVAAQLH
jgi:hypothetical protein